MALLQDIYDSPEATVELKEEYEVNMEMVKSIERFIEEMSKNKDERDRA